MGAEMLSWGWGRNWAVECWVDNWEVDWRVWYIPRRRLGRIKVQRPFVLLDYSFAAAWK